MKVSFTYLIFLEVKQDHLYPNRFEQIDGISKDSFEENAFPNIDDLHLDEIKRTQIQNQPPEMRDQSNELFDKFGMVKNQNQDVKSHGSYIDADAFQQDYDPRNFANYKDDPMNIKAEVPVQNLAEQKEGHVSVLSYQKLIEVYKYLALWNGQIL